MTTNLDLTDLRRVFMASQDIADISAVSVADAVPGINTKYARQILQALTQVGLLYPSNPFEKGTHQGYYWDQGAEVAFNEAFNLSNTITKEKHTVKIIDTPTIAHATGSVINCLCHCGLQVSAKDRQYLPGHDARHASMVAKNLAAMVKQGHYKTLEDAVKVEGLDGLVGLLALKATNQAERILTKGTKPSTSQTWEMGEAKVGRWIYPARKRPNGRKAEVNVRRDGKGTWKALDLDKFEVLGSN